MANPPAPESPTNGSRVALAERNRALAALRHRRTARERLRGALLQIAARVPVRPIAPPEPDTFLLIRPDHLGDMILTMPAVIALKTALPRARLIMLCGPWSAEVPSAYPEIDLALTLPFPGFVRGAGKSGLLAPYFQARRWAIQLRHIGPATALILRPDHWWGALLARLAGIPTRIGFGVRDVRPFLSEAIPVVAGDHAVLQGMKLVERWTGRVPLNAVRLSFPAAASQRVYIDQLLSERLPRGTDRFFVIHPGAGSTFKQWGAGNWAQVADRLADKLRATAVFTGAETESAQAREILGLMQTTGVSLAGETSVGSLAALYERALVVVGPDTGPLHLAVAAGAPTVHLFGPADTAQFGPWGSPSRQIALSVSLACRPCRILDWAGDDPANHPCIRDIPINRVIEAAVKAAENR